MYKFKVGDIITRTEKSLFPLKFGEVGQDYLVKEVTANGIDIGTGYLAACANFKISVSNCKPFGMLSKEEQNLIRDSDAVEEYTDEGTWEPYELRSFDLGRVYRLAQVLEDYIPWDNVSEDFMWHAYDESGVGYFFSDEPKLTSYNWISCNDSALCESTCLKAVVRGNLPWNKSLQTRKFV